MFKYFKFLKHIYIYIYIYIYISHTWTVYFLSAVHKSAQYYYRVFISINGKRINYKYIIATNSFMCVITIFRLYNMEENCLFHLVLLFHIVITIFRIYIMKENCLSKRTVLFHIVQPEVCDNTHETFSSYNVFVVYLSWKPP